MEEEFSYKEIEKSWVKPWDLPKEDLTVERKESYNGADRLYRWRYLEMNRTDQILRKQMSLNRKAMINISIMMTVFYLLSIAFYFCVHFVTKQTVSEHAVRSIANISQLNKDSVFRALDNRRMLLKSYADELEAQNLDEKEMSSILAGWEELTSPYDFYKVGVMDESRMVYFVDGKVEDGSENSLSDEVWDDQFHLSKSYMPFGEREYALNLFSYPVHYKGELKYVLLAFYHSKNLTERMNISFMEDKGYTFLVNREGEVVIYPQHYKNQSYNDLMKYVNDTLEIHPQEKGGQYFEYEGERFYAYAEELGINDWLLMTCIKETDMLADARKITKVVYTIAAMAWCSVFFAIAGGFYTMRRTRMKRTKEMYYDDLLNIPNKSALSVIYENLSQDKLEKMYMVIFDIDKFKEFNYIHGDEVGNRLLQYITGVLKEIEPNVYLFRYMSDYFVVLDRSESLKDYEEKIQYVLSRFSKDIEKGIIPPFDLSAGVRKIQVGDSLPIVISDSLVARDTVKGNHLSSYAFYNEDIRKKRMRYMEIESEFPRAVREKEIQVYYQPKVDIRTGAIVGAEALARWIKPDGTMISPGDFIPCLETSRQIIMLDEEILSEVCRQMKEMEQEGLDVKRVSVNLSRVHLRHPGILPKIEQTIEQFQIDPANLSFEITETALYEDSIPLKNIVENLHALGCKVELDDYGVGVSGPKSLAQNEFDTVKLDKSLVDGLGNLRMEDVIYSTAHMVKKWGMSVLVEGVEEKCQAERLEELGCSYAQGFYYYRPLPAEAYRALLKK